MNQRVLVAMKQRGSKTMVATKCQTENRPYMGGFNHIDKTIVVYRPDCKMWSCPHCASVRKSYLAIKTYTGYEYYRSIDKQHEISDRWYFATVTSHEKLKTYTSTIAVWPKVWRKLKERIRRKHNSRRQSKLRYVYVPELHEDGRLHGHFITNAAITQTELKDDNRACGGGYICDLDDIENAEHAAWYVSKYIHKGLDVYQWPPKFHRIRFTNNWPEPPANEDFNQVDLDVEWKYLGYMHNPVNYAEMMAQTGWKVDIISQK